MSSVAAAAAAAATAGAAAAGAAAAVVTVLQKIEERSTMMPKILKYDLSELVQPCADFR
jgi:hypothetical protein